jgi:hypothetical protein
MSLLLVERHSYPVRQAWRHGQTRRPERGQSALSPRQRQSYDRCDHDKSTCESVRWTNPASTLYCPRLWGARHALLLTFEGRRKVNFISLSNVRQAHLNTSVAFG